MGSYKEKNSIDKVINDAVLIQVLHYLLAIQEPENYNQDKYPKFY